MIKQFFKASLKLEQILIIINENYLISMGVDEAYVKELNKLDKKILITNFYVNAIIKLFFSDFRNIMINYIRE